MSRPSGSWVAIPTPFNHDGSVDYPGFGQLIDFHQQHGTSFLFVLGSAGETTLLSLEEKQRIVREVVKASRGKLPVYFGTGFPTTADTVKFAQYAEAEGADGLIFIVPPYVLPPQSAVYEHLQTCMSAVNLPVGIYNNPSRVGVNIEPETIERLAAARENFVVDKEAMPNVRQLVEVKRRLGDRLNLLCCDFPKYSIVLPTLALGGNGLANIGGNIIPEEMAKIARPWASMEIIQESRDLYLHYFEFLDALYWFSNPIVVKAAYNILGLPSGPLRRPYVELQGKKLEELRQLMQRLGIIEKYGR